jgi:hypothetical protein
MKMIVRWDHRLCHHQRHHHCHLLLLSQLHFVELPLLVGDPLRLDQSLLAGHPDLVIGHPLAGPMPLANDLNRPAVNHLNIAKGHRLVIGGHLLARGFPLTSGTVHIPKPPRLREGLQSLHQQHVEILPSHSFSLRFLRLERTQCLPDLPFRSIILAPCQSRVCFSKRAS